MRVPQYLRFLIAGGVAAVANFSSRFLFNIYLEYLYSVALAYFVGMFVAFLLMREHVFVSSRSLKFQVISFLVVNLIAFLQTLLVSFFLAMWLLPLIGIVSHSKAIGHLIGVILPVITSYFGHKFITFK